MTARTPQSLLDKLSQPVPDPGAWAQFDFLYRPMIAKWSKRRGDQESDTEELIQEVYQQLLKVFPGFKYDPDKRFRGFLKTITLQ